MNAPLTPPADDIVRYDAAIRWAVHLERERLLKDVLALDPSCCGGCGSCDGVARDAVVRVIG